MKQLHPSCIILLASASILAIAGCGGAPLHSIPAAPGPAATSIYVAQNNTLNASGPPQVLQFPTSATGNPAPSNTITYAASPTLSAIATDASGNIYVASSTDLREYAAGTTGTATPLRLIPANATTTLGAVTGLTVDASGNIYAAEQSGGIAVFSSTANGSVAPTRYILGASQTGGGLSTLQTPGALATDSSGNLYVLDTKPNASDLDAIDVFSPTANGNVAPTATITGAQVGFVKGIAIDSADNLYTSNNLNIDSIYVYAPGATGNATPTRSITGLGTLYGVAVDSAGNIYAVVDGTPLNSLLPGSPTVQVFSATASGAATPTSTFTSLDWTVSSPLVLALVE